MIPQYIIFTYEIVEVKGKKEDIAGDKSISVNTLQ